MYHFLYHFWLPYPALIARCANTANVVAAGNFAREHGLKVAIRGELGDERGIGVLLHNLGFVARYRGDYRQAATFFEENLPLFQKLGNKRGIFCSLKGLAGVAGGKGSPERAGCLRPSRPCMKSFGFVWAMLTKSNMTARWPPWPGPRVVNGRWNRPLKRPRPSGSSAKGASSYQWRSPAQKPDNKQQHGPIRAGRRHRRGGAAR